MKNKNKQSGSAFTVSVVVLSVAIVGVIGFIFWYNFSQTKPNSPNHDSSKNNTTKTESSDKTNKNDTVSDGDETDDSPDVVDDGTVKYFVIDFWNIKGVYSGSHYISYSIPSENLLVFDSKDLPETCSSGVARIKRFAADDYTRGYPASSVSENTSNQKASVVFAKNSYTSEGGNRKVGEYYYVLTAPMQYCVDSGSANLQKTIFADVLKYFKTLKAN